jgi:hypothetical protein
LTEDKEYRGKAKATGTKQWSEANFNFLRGCPNICRYCYARQICTRLGLHTGPWSEYVVNFNKVYPHDKVVMCPSTHDIFMEVIEEAKEAYENLLAKNNRVIIVTKAHLDVVQVLSKHLDQHKDRILWRITVGSDNDKILKFWEPGAPTWEERFAALQYLFQQGHNTSVSMEPLLDIGVVSIFEQLKPFVTESIWIGCLNKLEERVNFKDVAINDRERFLADIEILNSEEFIKGVYKHLRDEPLVRWKESYQKYLDLPNVRDKVNIIGWN